MRRDPRNTVLESASLAQQADGQASQDVATYEIVAAWHAAEGHPGRFAQCDQQPCHAIHFDHRRL